jgi:hypothetical protein
MLLSTLVALYDFLKCLDDPLSLPLFLVQPIFPVFDRRKSFDNSPDMGRFTRDDLMVEEEAKVNVDYLSNPWDHGEIWATRRYILHKRRPGPHNKQRLENTLWRAWVKSSQQLPCFPATLLNWLVSSLPKSLMFRNKERSLLTCCRDKDSDATWLYGPLIPDSNSGPTSNNLFPCQPRQIWPKPSLKRELSIWEESNITKFSREKSLLSKLWWITRQSVVTVSWHPRPVLSN